MRNIWTALLIFGLVAPVVAQPVEPALPPATEPGEEPPRPAMMKPPAEQGPCGFERVGLTSEQVEKLGKLQIALVKEIAPLEAELRVKELELAGLWRAEKFDPKAIIAKVKEIAEIRTKLELARVTNRIESFKLLTPEQQKRAREMFRRGEEWWEKGPGHYFRADRPHQQHRWRFRRRMCPRQQAD